MTSTIENNPREINPAAAATEATKDEDLAVVCLGTVCLSTAQVPAAGAILLPRSQNRSIAIELAVPGAGPLLSQRQAAAGFGVFNQGNSVAGVIRQRHHYLVQSNQTSEIKAATIAAAGQVTVVPTTCFHAAAQSDFAVGFELAQSVSFKLVGDLTWKQAGRSTGNPVCPVVTLMGPGGVVYQTPPPPTSGKPMDYSTSGILPPGSYLLEAHAGEAKSPGNASGVQGYTVVLAVNP